jgi:hypothetical protein
METATRIMVWPRCWRFPREISLCPNRIPEFCAIRPVKSIPTSVFEGFEVTCINVTFVKETKVQPRPFWGQSFPTEADVGPKVPLLGPGPPQENRCLAPALIPLPSRGNDLFKRTRGFPFEHFLRQRWISEQPWRITLAPGCDALGHLLPRHPFDRRNHLVHGMALAGSEIQLG